MVTVNSMACSYCRIMHLTTMRCGCWRSTLKASILAQWTHIKKAPASGSKTRAPLWRGDITLQCLFLVTRRPWTALSGSPSVVLCLHSLPQRVECGSVCGRLLILSSAFVAPCWLAGTVYCLGHFALSHVQHKTNCKHPTVFKHSIERFLNLP